MKITENILILVSRLFLKVESSKKTKLNIVHRISNQLGIVTESRTLFSLLIVNLAFIGFAIAFFIRDLVAILTDSEIFMSVTYRMAVIFSLSVLSIFFSRRSQKISIYITCCIPLFILYVYPVFFMPYQIINESLVINMLTLYLACTLPFILFNISKEMTSIVALNIIIFLVHIIIQYKNVYYTTLPLKGDLVMYFRENYIVLLLFQTCVWQFFFWLLYTTYSKNERYQKALKEYNITVHDQNSEIEAQNEELKQQQEHIYSVNELLEKLVEERTLKLNNLNSKLIEYAYVNSHLLRAPLCRIQGLRNLIKFDPDNISEYQGYLDQSFDELKLRTLYIRNLTDQPKRNKT